MIVAAYQGFSPEGNIESALAKVDETLAKAVDKNVEMVVFPELYFPGYNQMESHHSVAQKQGESWEIQLSLLAKKHGCGLTLGWAEREGDSIYNSASTFDRTGKKLAHFRKFSFGCNRAIDI